MKTNRRFVCSQPTRLTSAGFPASAHRCAAVAAATLLSGPLALAAVITWDNGAGDALWTSGTNWSTNTVPAAADDLVFGSAGSGIIVLNGNQTANSLTFTSNFTLGAYGVASTLTTTLTDPADTINVAPGVLATINAAITNPNPWPLIIDGGGTLFLNNPQPNFAGNWVVDGAGTTLLHRQEGPAVQYNAVGGAQEFGRFDQLSLGVSTAVKTITLQNGGSYQIFGTGNNSEGNYKNIVIGTGGGTLNLAAGYILQNLDDVGQITATTEAFTKAGKGRLVVTGGMANANPLGGIVNIDGGMLSLDARTEQTVNGNLYFRFTGIDGTAGTGSTVNINNGGTLLVNNGTQATFDAPVINANNGSIIAIQGQDHVFGYSTATVGGPTVLTVSGTSTLLARDLFGPQTQRFPRLRAELDGTGTLELRGSTGAGNTPRLVIERSTPGSDFSGTFRLVENTSLEANPRFNTSAAGGTGTSVDTGKVLAGGDVEFAGWGGTLDVRDSNPAAASVLDYTTNEITVTTTQAGALNTISVNRATTATGTGHLLNFGTLTLGNHRVAISGGNSYQAGFADAASLQGNAVIEMRTDNTPLVFSNAAALTENAAGRSLTIFKTGVGNAAARDVISGGSISISDLEVAIGTLQLRGASGAIATAFGGAAPVVTVNGGANPAYTNSMPTQGVLHLDNNTGHVVGATTVFAAANNNDRLVNSATVNLLGNSILRLTSANNTGTTETIGTTNVTGHGTFDVVKTGTAASPVALTVSTLSMGANATANFTGTSLGLVGTNTSRIIIPGTATGFLPSQFHSGNEWAKYDSTIDNGFELGVTPFVALDYNATNTAEATWAAGQQVKLTLGGTFLTGDRTVDRFNMQVAGTNSINLNTFDLTFAEGGVITSGATAVGFIDTNGAFPGTTGVLTAGVAATPSPLYFYANSPTDIKVPIADNAAGGVVDFIKSGTNTVRLTHHSLGVGTGATGINPYTDPTWSSTLSGNWIVTDGRLEVHRGQFLGGRPVILDGGHLEINEPVSNANADTIIPGWGNNITINANAAVAADDNGESSDGNTGDRAMVRLGSLTINNGAIMGHSSFSDIDIAYMGGATFSGTPTLNAIRGGTNSATIINGALTGSGFNMTATNGNASVVLGGGSPDITANTYNGAITSYAGIVRLNKANGITAVTDGAAAEDIVINGGTLAWGPGQHGDLSTTNNINLTNNGLLGIAPTSPAAVQAAGMNQIADTADITLLFGTLGEGDRINNEIFGSLVMKNGTFNVGLGSIVVHDATISGGAFNIDRGGSFTAGTLTLLPGAPDLNITTGIPAGAQTTLEIGAGGVSMTGQNIVLGTGSSANVMGSGGILKLGGNVTYTGTDLIGGSYGRKGIFVQIGNTFRQLGNSQVDLLGGNREFNIDTDSIFTITPQIVNGGLIKSGGGALVLEPYQGNAFAGPITVNAGVLEAKGDGALGTSAGGVTIASGGTVKLNSGWTWGDNFTVTGPGALVPGGLGVREVGALVAESGTNRLTGTVAISGDATLAGNTFLDPSVAPGAGGMAYRIGTLRIESAGGLTGSGTVTLSGHGDGVIVNGINTIAGGVNKDGAGRWTIADSSSYLGATVVSAGTLRITDGGALGSALAGTTVYGGGALELLHGVGIPVAEPLTLGGDGSSTRSGAVVNVGGANTLTAPITLLGGTLYSQAGSLTVTNTVTGGTNPLTLAGTGNGLISGNLTAGTLTKAGVGTWTLSGSNTLGGAAEVFGGTLALNYATSNTAKLSAANPLAMRGGNLSLQGSSAANTVQTVASLDLNEGGGSIVVANGVGRTATLNLGAINRALNNGTTVDFTLPAAGAITTSATPVNGILGSYATVAGQDWATTSGGNIVALASYTPLATATATDNAQVTASSALTAATTVNSLKVGGATVGLDLGANSLQLNSGGLLFTGTGSTGITGTGLLSGATIGDELVIHTASGSLDIAAPIIGSGFGGLTKDGAGELVLSGNNAFTGPININGGTLTIVGTGGNHPAALGAQSGVRDIILNDGTFRVLGDYNFNVSAGSNMRLFVGPAGGSLDAAFGGTVLLDDANEFAGSGDLTITGGGRVSITQNNSIFTGGVVVNRGILTVGNAFALGGRQEQPITLKPGSAIINNTAFGLGQNGLPNNLVAEGGVEFFAAGGNRVFGGDIQLSGTNTIALFELDSLAQERQIFFNGRVSGTDVTLNVFGANNANPFYLASGSNDLTGTINLNPNAVLEARVPGSLGLNDGDVTVNLATNSRLLLRHFQNADYHTDVVVNGHAEINSDRLNSYAGGGQQILSIHDLTVNGDSTILTVGGGNNYYTRVSGMTTLKGATSNILNVTASDLILENGLTFDTPSSTLDKRGGFTAILRQPTDHAGKLILQGGLVYLQDNGALPTTTSIDLRGGTLQVDNSNLLLADRINNAASISLGGGALRITGPETIGTVTASSGVTQVISNPISETTPVPLTLTGFTRATGAIVQFQSPDLGPTAVGTGTIGQPRVSSRILLPVAPTLADTGQTIPGFVGNNAIDFIQYSTTLDGGVALGFRDMRNPGSGAAFATNYTDNAAETAWNDTVILRRTVAADATAVTDTLTANRALDAIKVEAGGTNRDVTIALGAFNLRIEGGGILDVGNGTHDLNITGTTGVLTAGPAIAGFDTAELVIGGTAGGSAFNIGAIVADNFDGTNTQPVAVVKVGANTISLNGNNTFTGGLYVNSGTLNTTNPLFNGSSAGVVTLAGGTLQFNIGNAASALDLGVPDHSIDVKANSLIVLDNGALAGTDNDITLGSLTIDGPYTLGLRSFDSMDAKFSGAHFFAGTPTFDMAQLGSGGNQTGFFTIDGEISGSGFRVGTSGATDNTVSVLQIGAGEAVDNTYVGDLTLLFGAGSTGSNTDDLRVELNKADGFNAVTGNIVINGGVLRNVQPNQIANSSNMLINQGAYDAFGKDETFASVTMRGGNFRTNSPATGSNTVTITGDFNATGLDNLGGSVDGVAVNSNSTLDINGTLRLNGYSRGTMGGTASNMILGGLEMTGTTLFQNGAGSLLRLNGDVTTLASSNTARLGATTVVGAQIQLNDVRTFTVADGPAGLDLSVSSSLRDSTSPVAAGSLVKNGPGMMQLEGAATVNDYTGTTAVNEGTLVLWKSVGIDAIPAGALTIGDGTGGANADQVIIRNNQQIADVNNVTIASSGLLDLSTFNTSERVGSLTGTGNVTLGPGSVLTVGGTGSAVFSGLITGAGSFVKEGAGSQTLAGTHTYSGTTRVNDGTLVLANGASIASSATTVGDGAGPATLDIAGSGTIGAATTGALIFGANSITVADLRSTIGSAGLDRFNANGKLSIVTGAQLTLNEVGLSEVLAAGTKLALVNYTGFAWDLGIFTGLSDGSSFIFGANRWKIDYDDTTDGTNAGNFVTLTVVTGSPYDLWAADQIPPLAGGSEDGDADGDGVKNGVEFALDGNPNDPANTGKLITRLINLDGDLDGTTLTLTIPVRVGDGSPFLGANAKSAIRDEITYTIEGSTDLVTWTTEVVTDVTGNTAIDNTGLPALTSAEWQYRTFRVSGDIASAPRKFLRGKFAW